MTETAAAAAAHAPSLRDHLYIIVFESETPAGQAFDIVLLVCILMSIGTTMLETVPEIRRPYKLYFELSENIFTSIFTLEYLVRVSIARPKPASFICSFFGLVDLCAVLPSLIVVMLLPDSGAATNLRLVRVLRLLRVFRVLHFVGLSDEAEALRAAFWASRRKIGVFLYMILTIVTVMGTIVYVVEDNTHSGFTSIPRSIYWAIVTVTTVGYGDIVPQTVSGQTIASIMMILGYAILAVPTGIVVADMQMRGRPPSSKRTMRARGLSRELRAVDTLACTTCESVGHDADASFCKNCGAELCV